MSETDCSLSRRGFVIAGVAATGVGLTATLAHGHAGSPAMQTTIRTDNQVITLISVFAVEPDKLKSLVNVLRDGTETSFVSSCVLTAKDGRQAINYSQWKSADYIAGYRRDPRFQPYIQQLLALAKAQTIECDVAYVRSA